MWIDLQYDLKGLWCHRYGVVCKGGYSMNIWTRKRSALFYLFDLIGLKKSAAFVCTKREPGSTQSTLPISMILQNNPFFFVKLVHFSCFS
jgi:hypothetical protein